MASMTITITVPDAHAARVRDAFARYHGWTEMLPDEFGNPTVPNPLTQVQFIRQVFAKFVKESVKAYEAQRDAEAARLATAAVVEGMVIE